MWPASGAADLRDIERLREIERIAGEQRDTIDSLTPPHRLSSQLAQGRGQRSIFDMAAKQAATRARMVELASEQTGPLIEILRATTRRLPRPADLRLAYASPFQSLTTGPPATARSSARCHAARHVKPSARIRSSPSVPVTTQTGPPASTAMNAVSPTFYPRRGAGRARRRSRRPGHPAGRAPCPAAPHPARPWPLAPIGTTSLSGPRTESPGRRATSQR